MVCNASSQLTLDVMSCTSLDGTSVCTAEALPACSHHCLSGATVAVASPTPLPALNVLLHLPCSLALLLGCSAGRSGISAEAVNRRLAEHLAGPA